MKVWVLTGLLLGCFGSAFAGTVRLRSGTLDFDSVVVGDGPVHLEGDRDFSFEGFAELAFIKSADCGFECDPRETVDLGMTVSGNDLPGVVEMAGKTYTDVGGLISTSSMVITITGKGTVPLLGTSSQKIRSYPVKIVAQFFHYEGIPFAPEVENLVAKGKATVTWTKYEEDSWYISHLTYNIGPTH